MMYPIQITDNFFPDPDKIVDFAMNQEFFPNPYGRWPGKRTKSLNEIDKEFYNYVMHKILSLYHYRVDAYHANLYFQLIKPFTTDQYNAKNIGWIHKDDGCLLSSIIYLNKNPEKDTGTNIYRQLNGYSFYPESTIDIKSRHYLGHHVKDNEYEQSIYSTNSKFEEVVNVKNVYNRVLSFGNDQFHGVQTFGKEQERLTLVCFVYSIYTNEIPPTYR